jgi:hypothetical protein
MPEEKRQQEDLQPFIELQEKLAMNISFQQAVSCHSLVMCSLIGSCSTQEAWHKLLVACMLLRTASD